jgi:polysaccharide export outer membrane protein
LVNRIFSFLIVLTCAGCAAMPSHGPASNAIVSGAVAQGGTVSDGSAQGSALSYVLVNVNSDILSKIRTVVPTAFTGTLNDRNPTPFGLILGPGDVISLTIFESAPGGLFTPSQVAGARPGNFVELPPQTIDREGKINVPYAGEILVSGRTPRMVENEVQQLLQRRAIEPRVVLTVREQRSAQASVLGEVNAPTRFSLNPQGDRVLDALARAGGPKYPAYETIIALQRAGRKAQIGLAELVRQPANNILLRPGDTVFVSREQRHFVALGASGQNGVFFFDSERVTLAYAMGKAGGLLDERAEPGAVFIYRVESRQNLERYGMDLPAEGKVIPTVYAINLRDPSGFFLAQNIELQHHDVIFVGNTTTVDLAKTLQFIRLGINSVRDGVELGQSF